MSDSVSTSPHILEFPAPVREDELPQHIPAAEVDQSLLDAEPSSPVPADFRVYLGGLFLMGLLACCYTASEIILPIVLAFILMLVLQPAMRMLERLHVPRPIAALGIILLFFGLMTGIGTVLSGPAVEWAQKLPAGVAKLQERLSFISEPITTAQRFLQRAEALTRGSATVAVEGAGLQQRLIDGTRIIASGLLETVLVLFFLLVSGDTFLRRLVEVLPRFKNKRQAVAISQQVESDIAAYLATITLMNAAVGIATALVAMFCGLGDPLLWGTLAFLLNYVPILGPMIGISVLLLAGLLSIDTLWVAFLPAGLYMCIHMIEGETVTPMLLARRFTINPVLVVLALVFWYWMWGIPGAILATPMLAVAKIICDHVECLMPFGHFIEG
jgi:predicted PurR-regulated permease PerM